MRTAAPVFQLYRFGGEDGLWWRLVSPNGRGMARSMSAFGTVGDARTSLTVLAEHVAELELGVRLTSEYRWHWTARFGGDPLAEGIGDQDRRVRCTDAGNRFVALAPQATVALDVAVFRRTWRVPGTSAPVQRSQQRTVL